MGERNCNSLRKMLMSSKPPTQKPHVSEQGKKSEGRFKGTGEKIFKIAWSARISWSKRPSSAASAVWSPAVQMILFWSLERPVDRYEFYCRPSRMQRQNPQDTLHQGPRNLLFKQHCLPDWLCQMQLNTIHEGNRKFPAEPILQPSARH